MNTDNVIQQGKQSIILNRPMLLSKLWVFLSLNYILCDLISNMEMSALRGLLDGEIAGITMTQEFLLFAAITLEIPFLMVVLSAVLPYKANRIINIGVGILMMIYQLGSFFVGSDATLHYIFFSGIEVIGNVVIVILAFRWKR